MGNNLLPAPVKITKWCFWFLAVLWIILGGYTLFGLVKGPGEPKIYMWIVTGLMFANALVMAWLGWGIGRRSRRFFYLAAAYLAVNIILTITDDFGTADLIYLIASVGLLGLLLATGSRYS